MFKRRDFKVITIAIKTLLDNSSHKGILISKNKRWLYFWKVVDFRIDGCILVRRSQVISWKEQKMSKLQYRAMKTLGEFDKIDAESEVKLPKSDKKVLKLANKASVVISQETGDQTGDIKKVGKSRITFNKFTSKGNTVFGKQAYIEDIYMLHINSEHALTYSLFSK